MGYGTIGDFAKPICGAIMNTAYMKWALLLLALAAATAWGATTAVISVPMAGSTGDSGSYMAAMTPDGRYVAFESDATNLVSGDSNLVRDIFLRDRQLGTTQRVSVSSSGGQANGASFGPTISADGRYVAFSSDATNLVTGDTNAVHDVFVRDTVSHTTVRVSVSSGGVQGNAASYSGFVSGDGTVVAFSSDATNLVSGDTNAVRDIFLRRLGTNTTIRLSVNTGGTQGNGACYSPAVSQFGQYVAFTSEATNLVVGDTNAMRDIFVRNVGGSTTTRVSVSGATQANGPCYSPSVSSDGSYVAFSSDANNLVTGDTNAVRDVFVWSRATNQSRLLSVNNAGVEGNAASYYPTLSPNGRWLGFSSDASNLVTADTNAFRDVFLRDTVANLTAIQSLAPDGGLGNNNASGASVSNDGRYVAFSSDATNLAAGDANAKSDIFARDNGMLPSYSPANGATNCSRWGPVNLTFRWPVVRTSAQSHFTLVLQGSTAAIPGTFKWTNNQIVSFRPNAALQALKTYIVTLTPGIQRQDLSLIDCSDTFYFTTGNQPIVTAWLPKGNAVATTAKIVVTFSVPMNKTSVQSKFSVTPALTGSFAWSNLDKTVTFTPSPALTASRLYTVTIAGAATSAAGAAMQYPFSWSFTTGAAALAMAAAAAPTQDGNVQIAVQLTAAAEVQVTVMNIAGWAASVLPPVQMTAGVNTVLWNGRSTMGTALPHGRYFLAIQAETADGTSTQCVVPVTR